MSNRTVIRTVITPRAITRRVGPVGPPGATTFAALTDKVTADLPAINTPLSSALSGKASTSHTHVSADVSDATSAATPSTLVRRDGNGGAIFGDVQTSIITASGILTTGLVEFNGTDAGDSLTFNMVNYTYGTGAASAHRIALGAGTTGATLFGAADVAVANAILNIVKIATADDNRTAATYADDSELFVSLEVGSWLVDLRLLWGIVSGANIAYRLQFTGVISTAVPIGHQLLRASISGQPTFNAGYTETVNNSCHGALLLLNVTTAGTFKIDHRNNNATGTSIRRAGSAIIAKKIA